MVLLRNNNKQQLKNLL